AEDEVDVRVLEVGDREDEDDDGTDAGDDLTPGGPEPLGRLTALPLAHDLPALGATRRAARAPLATGRDTRPAPRSLTTYPLSARRAGPLGPRSLRAGIPGPLHARSRLTRSRRDAPGRSGPARYGPGYPARSTLAHDLPALGAPRRAARAPLATGRDTRPAPRSLTTPPFPLVVNGTGRRRASRGPTAAGRGSRARGGCRAPRGRQVRGTRPGRTPDRDGGAAGRQPRRPAARAAPWGWPSRAGSTRRRPTPRGRR